MQKLFNVVRAIVGVLVVLLIVEALIITIRWAIGYPANDVLIRTFFVTFGWFVFSLFTYGMKYQN